MGLKEIIEKRKSIRSFTDEKVPVNVLKELVELAGRAPSINDSEPWRFIAITNKYLLKDMADVVKTKLREVFPVDLSEETDRVRSKVQKFSSFFADAPAVIAVLHEPYKAVVDDILVGTDLSHEDINRMRNYPNIQTIGAAIENMLLGAVEMGYGACWLTGPLVAKEELEKLLNIKEPFSLVAFVAIGKEKGQILPREKKKVDDIFEIIE